MTPRLVYCSQQSSRMMGMDLPVKCWDPILFPCTFFPQNPRQGSNHFKGCSSSGYREVFGLCVHWPCSPINNTMSQPSLDTHRSSLLPQRKLQMPLPASGQVISIFLFFESDMLTSASIFLLTFILSKAVSFRPFRAAQFSQVLPPSSNSPCWLMSHSGSSAPDFNPSASLHQGFSNLLHTDLHSFFFFLSFKAEKFQTQSRGK